MKYEHANDGDWDQKVKQKHVPTSWICLKNVGTWYQMTFGMLAYYLQRVGINFCWQVVMKYEHANDGDWASEVKQKHVPTP